MSLLLRLPLVLLSSAVLSGARPASLEAQAPSHMRLREELRIGGASQDIFGLDVAVVSGPRGQVAVFGGGKGTLKLYDATGRRTGEFGGRGAGPGEFLQSPVGQFFVQLGSVGDSIWALDRIQRRFTVFAWNGSVVRTTRYPEPDSADVVSFVPMGILSGNRVVGKAAVAAPGGRLDSAIVLLTGNGSVERRIADVPGDSTLAVHIAPNGGRRSSPVPFRWDPRPAVSPNGERFAVLTVRATGERQAEARLTVLTSEGDTSYSRTIQVATEPVTRSMADSALKRLAGLTARTPELATMVRERIPPFVAPFQNPLVGDDGTVWLPRNVVTGQAAAYMVFDSRGASLGELHMPRPRIRAYNVSGDHVIALETTDDGFVDVVRYRVERDLQ